MTKTADTLYRLSAHRSSSRTSGDLGALVARIGLRHIARASSVVAGHGTIRAWRVHGVAVGEEIVGSCQTRLQLCNSSRRRALVAVRRMSKACSIAASAVSTGEVRRKEKVAALVQHMTAGVRAWCAPLRRSGGSARISAAGARARPFASDETGRWAPDYQSASMI